MRRILTFFTLVAALSLTTVIPAMALQDFYQSNFKGWRDGTTNSEFNSTFKRSGKTAIVGVKSSAQFGKVMSPQTPIIMNVTPGLILQIVVDEVDESSALSVEVVSAGPPYDGHKILSNITEPGRYNASIGSGAKWSGEKSFWIAIWVDGGGKQATVGKLRIGENIAKVGRSEKKKKAVQKKIVKVKSTKKKVDPKAEVDAKKYQVDFRDMDNYKYFEDWSKGRNGWRDETTNKGMNVIATVKKGGRVRLSLPKNTTYGKFSSPEKPIVVDFRKHPFIEVELERELEVGRVKVQLTQARNPDNYRVVIPKFSRRGVYIANVPEVSGWRKKQAFFIDIWLEGAETEVNIRSIGFSKKMSVLQGIMTPIQSVSASELAPSKSSDILKVSGVADQIYRGQWLEGSAAQTGWDERDRYGQKKIDVGYSEITQKLYIMAAIHPAEGLDIYSNLGYDFVNEYDGVVWEDIYGGTVKGKMSFLLVKYFDFYAGDVSQIGSVYDPLFTDLTFKKASPFRGFLWKPQVGDFNFKLFGTRMYTDTSTFQENIFMTGLRASNYFSFAPGSIRVGLNAVNLSRSNGEMDENIFQGKVDPSEYQTYAPSIYIRISNNSGHHMFYSGVHDNEVTISASATISADFDPNAGGTSYIYDQNKTFFNAGDESNLVQVIYSGGYIIYRIPLTNNGDIVEPESIGSITAGFEGGAYEELSGVYTGTLDISISSNGSDWVDLAESPWVARLPENGHTYADYAELISLSDTSEALIEVKNGDFDSTEETVARSILSADLSGQLFGVNVEAEYALSLAHNQTFRGEHTTRQANAFFCKLSKGFSGALLKAAYFQMMPEFDTSLSSYNSVDDNDNGAVLNDDHADKSGVVFNDYSNRGYPDKEYVVGLYVPEDYILHEKDDRNHNGILDSRENDHEPDYTYRRDQRGYDISFTVPLGLFEGLVVSDMEMELRALDIERISTGERNRTYDGQVSYINTDIENLKIKFGVYIASIRDELSTQYTMYTAADDVITTEVAYENNVVVSPELQVLYDAPWGLKATLQNRYRYNRSFVEDTLPERKGNETTVDLRYKHYVKGGFSITPIYQARFNSTQANISSPIHNTYYVANDVASFNDIRDIPIFHGFYLKNSYPIMEEYVLALDIGREISMHAMRGMPDKIYDRLAVGLLRDLPRGYLRLHWELNKAYYPYENGENWGQSALWAQFTITF